jgi:hypothetical protein
MRPGDARRLLLGTAGVAVAVLIGGGVAVAAFPQPPIRTTTPHREKDVKNLDLVLSTPSES